VRKKIKVWIEYIAVRFAESVFQSVSRPLSLKWGEWLGVIFSIFLSQRKRLIIENLEHAFPEKKFSEIKKIARAVWRNLGKTAVEFIRLDEINQDNYPEFVTFEGEETVRKAAREGRGLIFIGFHMANWELTGYVTSLHFGNLTVIARPIKNPLVDNWVQSKRKKGGFEIIPHRNAVKGSLGNLRMKKYVGILVDQNLYEGGVFVDFFGRPAATTTLPAILYDRTKAPLLIVYSLRQGGKFKIVYEGPLNLPDVPDPKERLFLHTQIINNELEKIIRKNPESWFWIHNRWKRRPENAAGGENMAGASPDE